MKNRRWREDVAPVLWSGLAAGALLYAGVRRSRGRRQLDVVARRIPRDRWLDSTLALWRDGYEFIPSRCRRFGSDIFATRLLLQEAICLQGEEWARLFYDPARFRRHGAAPRRLQRTLFGKPGVQALDGAAHRHRKEMFMSLMTPEKLDRLTETSAAEWEKALRRWSTMAEVVFFDATRELLCRTVCAWTGVPLPEADVRQRADDFEAMIDSPGRIGPRYVQGLIARRRAEAWIAALIEQVRAGELEAPAGQGLHTVAWHRDLDGHLLDPHEAAVELINVLRPTVAISRFLVFIALALHEHPQWRQKLQDEKEDVRQLFVQEVRRFYPFFPFVAARVREDFSWRGYRFPAKTRVLLDLYGTDRDPRLWQEPEAFRPERFRQWDGSAFNFIPQGGGDHFAGHRCAGEWVTIELMKVALDFLVRRMTYQVPPQDLRVSLSRMPALPKSRLVLRQVEAVG